MKRHELEHIIRAAAAITGLPEFVVIGSQSLLAQFPAPEAELVVSMEADVFPKDHSERSIEIDGAIGERSIFHETFGYYAHGVDESTATLPAGWRDRLVPLRNENTGGATGWCLEVHDLAASKLAAGREKDMQFVSALIRHGMVRRVQLDERIEDLPVPPDQRARIRAQVDRLRCEAL